MKDLPLIWQFLLFVLPIVLFIISVIFYKNEWYIKGHKEKAIIYIKRKRSVLTYILTFLVCLIPFVNILAFIIYTVDMIGEFFKGERRVYSDWHDYTYHPKCLFKSHSQSHKFEPIKNFLNKRI